MKPDFWQLGPGVGIGTTGDNRVVVVVPDEAKAQQVRQLAASKGVPASGLVVYVGQFRRDNLQGVVRPVVAGVQIAFPLPNPTSNCTIGALARRLDTGQEGFLTASHCSTTTFGPDGTQYGQPDAANLVAAEANDPLLAACPAGYPAGSQCRRSDVLFATWDAGFTNFSRGRIAYQGGVLNNPLAPIVGNSTVVGRAMSPADIPPGSYLWKVGRTTGTTLVGVVMSNNFDWQFAPNQFQIAQILTYKLPGNLGTAPGDSGSGLYIVSPSQTSVRLVAIHSASLEASSAHTLGIHSPIYGFEQDLGVPVGTFLLTP